MFSPFNKVEESFFIQATHDLLFLKWGKESLSFFDHSTFPGVVPRSFIGPLLLYPPASLVGSIIEWILSNAIRNQHSAIGDFPLPLPDSTTKLSFQYGARFALALYCALSLVWIGSSLDKLAKTTKSYTLLNASLYFIMLCICQFHLMFWGSRTIANTFALIPFHVSIGCFLCVGSKEDRHMKNASRFYFDLMIFTLAFTCIIFRAEILPLSIILILLSMKKCPQYSLLRVIWIGVMSSVFSIFLTITIDSYFWQRWVWPELEVFLFNGIQGNSVEWGVSPWHYYFTNLLPRILPLSCILVFCCMADLIWPSKKDHNMTASTFILLALFHIAILSFIPHKEWRFIIYAIPLFNIAGALCICKMEKFLLAKLLIQVSIIGFFCLSLLMLYISHFNYSGGTALYQFHDVLRHHPIPSHPIVHIDTFAAMTGASRFGESSCCTFSKNESLVTPFDYLQFDWLISSHPEMHSPSVWSIVDRIEGYSGVSIRNPIDWIKETIDLLLRGDFIMIRLPITVKLDEKLFLMKKR